MYYIKVIRGFLMLICKQIVLLTNNFERDDLIICNNPEDFKNFLFSQNFDNKSLLLMSSGNYGGLDFDAVRGLIE